MPLMNREREGEREGGGFYDFATPETSKRRGVGRGDGARLTSRGTELDLLRG